MFNWSINFKGLIYMKKSLYEKTLRLIQSRPHNLTFAEISSKIDIGEDWLRKFAQGKIKNPSVNRIQTLHDFLNDKPLKVN